jgi:aspartate aminotransferase
MFPHSRAPHTYRQFFDKMSHNAAADLLRYGKARAGCISLAQGEGSLVTPDFICEAATQAMREGKTFYGAGSGVMDLRQEIATYHARIYGHNIPTNRVTVTSSGTNAVHLALLSILNEGDEVVAVTPIWKNLIGITELAGGVIRDVPMTMENGKWHLNLNRLFDACNTYTKAIMLVSPNNPTGWVMAASDIKVVMEFARDRGIWVIADEVYGRTRHESSVAPSFLDFAADDDLLYVINSFSKTWAMTGWRLGWLIGPKDSEEKIRDLVLYENMGPPTFTQYAAIAALRHGEEFLLTQKALWRENLALIQSHWKNNERIHMAETDTAFYAFFRVAGEEDSLKFARRLIDEAGVSLAPGGAFGAGFNDYLRLCFGASPEAIGEALTRLNPFLQ